MPDPLPPEFADALALVGARLAPLGSRILYFRSVGSTNDVAGRYATAAHEGLVVVADEQTSGRGRTGRTWHSPPGAGLYTSVVLAPSRSGVDPVRARLLLTLAAGVGIAEGIARAIGLPPAIKWPNDLLIGGRKVCGILAEATDEIVLGYGINIAPAAFPPDVAGRATSLESELGRPVDRALVFAETLAGLAARYRDLLEGRFDAILDAWRRGAPGSSGTVVTWKTAAGLQSGTTAGVDESGALLVRVGDRLERLISGDVWEVR